MAVLSVTPTVAGQVPYTVFGGLNSKNSQSVQVIFIDTNDTLATVTATNYLNASRAVFGNVYANTQMALTYTTDIGPTWLRVFIDPNANPLTYNLVTPTEGSGVFSTVTLAVGSAAAPSLNFTGRLTTGLYSGGANEMDVACNGAKVAAFTTAGLAITGLISATTTIAAGTNITAGSASAAGTVTSFPGTANGSLIWKAIDAGSAHTTTVSNASSVGQNTVVTIPDPGAATASFVLSTSGSAQTIAGGLTISTGNLAVSQGNVTAGSSGHQGTVSAFPAGALAGSLVLSAIGNTGDTTVTISNAIHGQATVYSIPDVGAATGGLAVTTSNLIMKSVANTVVAGGAASQDVTDAFITAACTVIANWRDTTNPVQIQTVLAGAGKFTVVSSADPGASHIDYIVTKPA